MWAIFRRTIRDTRVSMIVFSIGSALFSLMYVALFPSLSKQSDVLIETLKSYPDSLNKVFDISYSSFQNLGSFLAMENFSIIWPILVISMCASWGGGSIAGEIERGTISMLLFQPISRLKLYASKYLSGLFNLMLFAIISIMIIIPMAAAYKIDYDIINYLKMLLVGGLFILAIYSFAIMLSTMFSEKGKVVFGTVGLMVLMYAANVVSALKDNLDSLKYVSFFHYLNASQVLTDGKIDTLAIVVFVLVIVVCSTIGGIVFIKRDIAV